MPNKPTPAEKHQQELFDICQSLEDHIRLARDYATTPGNTWMARDELNTIGRLVAELESKLSDLNADEKLE